MKYKIKYVFIGIIGLGLFLFGRQCGVSSIKIPIYKNETIIKRDTIWPDTTKIEVIKRVPYKVHDTEYVLAPYEMPLDSIKMNTFFKTRFYKRSYRNKEQEIIVSDSVVGYLIGQNVNYRSFKPLSIINSTIVSVIPQDTVKTLKKWELRGGIEATPHNIFLGLEYQKNRVSYDLAIDPINKIPGTNIPQPKVGLKYTFIRR